MAAEVDDSYRHSTVCCCWSWLCLIASEQWSTKAVITAPKPEDLLPMRKVAMQAEALGLKGFPSGKVLYQEFIQEFNAYENRREYLKASPLFAEQVEELGA